MRRPPEASGSPMRCMPPEQKVGYHQLAGLLLSE